MIVWCVLRGRWLCDLFFNPAIYTARIRTFWSIKSSLTKKFTLLKITFIQFAQNFDQNCVFPYRRKNLKVKDFENKGLFCTFSQHLRNCNQKYLSGCLAKGFKKECSRPTSSDTICGQVTKNKHATTCKIIKTSYVCKQVFIKFSYMFLVDISEI